MQSAILHWDRVFTLAINQFNSPVADPAMIFLSEKWVWLPLYAFIIWLIFRVFDTRSGLWILLGIGVSIAISDQLASGLLKPMFERLRPCHDPGMRPMLHLPNGCGGMFGFASSHAANTFCLAAWVTTLFGQRSPFAKLIWVWALFICWSRIYLGAHFLGDVVIGAFIGTMAAFYSIRLLPMVASLRPRKPIG